MTLVFHHYFESIVWHTFTFSSRSVSSQRSVFCARYPVHLVSNLKIIILLLAFSDVIQKQVARVKHTAIHCRRVQFHFVFCFLFFEKKKIEGKRKESNVSLRLRQTSVQCPTSRKPKWSDKSVCSLRFGYCSVFWMRIACLSIRKDIIQNRRSPQILEMKLRRDSFFFTEPNR